MNLKKNSVILFEKKLSVEVFKIGYKTHIVCSVSIKNGKGLLRALMQFSILFWLIPRSTENILLNNLMRKLLSCICHVYPPFFCLNQMLCLNNCF